MIVSACMFILGFAMTWAPLVLKCAFLVVEVNNVIRGIWIIIGETFPTRTRTKQAALATASNWWVLLAYLTHHLTLHRLWNFLLAFFTPFITSAIHFRYGFIFAGQS